MSRASSILHIAQPTLSQQIAYLETYFSIVLLNNKDIGGVNSEIQTIRLVIETAATRAQLKTNVIAQTESISVLAGLVGEGNDPADFRRPSDQTAGARHPFLSQSKTKMKVNMAICVSGQLPLSEPATAVRDRLAELSQDIANGRNTHEQKGRQHPARF